MFLRQSTQKSILTPRLVDDTDFKTAETVAFNAAGISVSVIQADGTVVPVTPAEAVGNWYWAHLSGGAHILTLKATDLAQLGPLRVQGSATGVLLWWRDFYVVEEQIYDSLFKMTETLDLLDTNAKTLNDASPNNLAAGAEMALTGAQVTALQGVLAEPGDEMALTGAAVSAVQGGLATDGGEMDLVDAPNATALAALADAILARTGFTAGGTTTVGAALKAIKALATGKIARRGATDVWDVYDDDGLTIVATFTFTTSGRTVA